MKLDKFQKAKVVLGLSLFVLLLAILFIPHIIDQDLSWASEDTLETLFLVLSFLAAIYVFWHYDYVVQKREEETSDLSLKLRDKEKELIETFQYLGKVNVQSSVIKDLLDRMKEPAPTTKEELADSVKELLNIACSATGRDRVWLKIVDTKNRKVVMEELAGYNLEKEDKEDKMTVRSLLDVYENKKSNKIDGCEIFYSDLDNFYIKAFLALPVDEGAISQGDELLKAISNQCEILFLLFDFQHYQPKNEKNEKK